MKKHRLISIVFVLTMLASIALWSENASANFDLQFTGSSLSESGQQAASTPIPTDSQSATPSVTPESRVLPPIGSNAGSGHRSKCARVDYYWWRFRLPAEAKSLTGLNS